MKRSSLIFILIGGLLLGAACAKSVPDETVALKMAEVICSKTQQCLPLLPADPSCILTVQNTYLTALGAGPKKGKVTEKELGACFSEIQAMGCAVFGQTTPPAACRFLSTGR